MSHTRNETGCDDHPEMAFPSQLDLVRRLWGQYTESSDERALDRWLEQRFRVSSLRFADQVVASKAIRALKNMIVCRLEDERFQNVCMAVAHACLERFGYERAPTWRQIRRYWRSSAEPNDSPRVIKCDAEIKAFIDETLPEIFEQRFRHTFGTDRAL